MDKEALKKVLLTEGLLEERDELFDDDVTLKDWVSRHEDLVRSNRAVAQALQVDAPHEVKEGYFKDADEQRQYDAGEKKYNEERAKKQQLADEYRRAKDIEDFSKFRWQNPFKVESLDDAAKLAKDNLIALGLTLTPQAAKNVYIKEGYKPYKIGAQAGIGTVANLSELVPGPGKAGKAVATFAGPAIRAGQDIYEGKDLSEVGENFAFDTGLNTLFTYMPAKEAYNYIKRIFGEGGEAGEKAIKNTADEILEQADLLENKNEALKNLGEQEHMLKQYQEAYKDMSDLERAKFIKDLKNTHPDLARALEENINVLGENRFHSEAADYIADNMDMNAFMKEAYDDLVKDIGPEKAKQLSEMLNPAEFEDFLEKQSAKRIAETAEDVDKAFNTAKRRTAEKKAAINDELFDEVGNLKTNVENLSEAAAYAQPNKLSQTIARYAPAGRGVARNVVTPSRKSAATEDKEYSSAIEYIIQSNKRQWKAGFAPRGGIELEAYNIAKERGEI